MESRFAVADINGFSRPPLRLAIAVGAVAKIAAIWPPIKSIIAGAAPLYGTCNMSMPVWRLNTSDAICSIEPLPAEPNASCPGFALASATSSATDFTGSEPLTTSTSGR